MHIYQINPYPTRVRVCLARSRESVTLLGDFNAHLGRMCGRRGIEDPNLQKSTMLVMDLLVKQLQSIQLGHTIN